MPRWFVVWRNQVRGSNRQPMQMSGPNLGFSLFLRDNARCLTRPSTDQKQTAICTKRKKHSKIHSDQKYTSCILSCTLGLLYSFPTAATCNSLFTPQLSSQETTGASFVLDFYIKTSGRMVQLPMIFQRSVLQKRLLNSQFHDGNDFDLQI